MNKLITITLLAFSLAGQAEGNQLQGAQFLTVGADNDNACDFHSIQSAIESGLSNTIRIASNKSYFENVEVQSLNRDLVGGYADCTQAGLNITDLSQAVITANGADTAIYVNNASGNVRDVTLRNLIVANGSVGVSIRSQNPGSILNATLNNVRAFNNNGRGLSVLELNTATAEVIVNNSVIDFNSNGGVDCEGSGSTLKITGNTLIENNQAIDNGSGIKIINGCALELYSPSIISNNESNGSGGGLYVSNAEADLIGLATTCANGICFGEWESPVIIENNVANADGNGGDNGGGISVINNSDVQIINTVVRNNEAHSGAGIAAFGGQTVVVGYESLGTPCWNVGRCSQINDNKASSSGGAIAVGSAGLMSVFQTSITGNRADTGAIAQTSGGAELDINSSLMYKNGNNGTGGYSDLSLFRLFPSMNFPSSTLKLDFVTISDNQTTGEVFDNGNGDLDVTSSIVFNENDTYVGSGNSPQANFECVMASENNSFSAGGTVTVVDHILQPVFVNPAVGNYHLLVNSPAIDYCYDASGNASSDIDYDDRGIDNPDVVNLHGPYDIGADEFNIANDIIFKHGFEQD